MRAIFIVMLGCQVGALLATAFALVLRKSTPTKSRSVWISLAFSLTVISAVSWNIADRHSTEPGVELLHFGSPLLLGMAIALSMMAIRDRRGLDRM